jgi:integrase
VGQWRSKTTGKTAYNEAKAFKREFLESLQSQYNPTNDRLKLTDAADAYMEHRLVAASAGTVRLEKERLRALKRLLAQITIPDLKLKDIDIKLVRSYQQKRIAEGVGPRTVNMEGQLLRSILKHHEQWKLDGKYEPLPEPVSEVGRSLTPEEEVRLLDSAKSCSDWFVAYHGTVLENETGMRGVEVRNLQLKRIEVLASEIRLQKTKSKGGVRTVTLTPDALKSVKGAASQSTATRSLPPGSLPHSCICEWRSRGEGRDTSSRSSLRSDETNEGMADGMAQTYS